MTHRRDCGCEECYWSAPWLHTDTEASWERDQQWAADRARRRGDAARDDRLRARWDAALCDLDGDELTRAHREHQTLAGIVVDVWRAADRGDEWAARQLAEWKARERQAWERVAAAQGAAVLARERWLHGDGDAGRVVGGHGVTVDAPSAELVALHANGYIEVPADGEDPAQRAVVDAAAALAVERLALPAAPSVTFISPAPPGVAPDWPPARGGVLNGMALWPDRIWVRAGMPPPQLIEVVAHEARHLWQGDKDPDVPLDADVERRHEDDAQRWAAGFVASFPTGAGVS